MICTIAFVILRFSDTDPLKTFWSAPLVQKIITAALFLVSIMMIYIPPLNRAFGFSAVDPLALLISIAAGILPPGVYYFVKHFFKTSADYDQ